VPLIAQERHQDSPVGREVINDQDGGRRFLPCPVPGRTAVELGGAVRAATADVDLGY
jgi:hypothetical protein